MHSNPMAAKPNGARKATTSAKPENSYVSSLPLPIPKPQTSSSNIFLLYSPPPVADLEHRHPSHDPDPPSKRRPNHRRDRSDHPWGSEENSPSRFQPLGRQCAQQGRAAEEFGMASWGEERVGCDGGDCGWWDYEVWGGKVLGCLGGGGRRGVMEVERGDWGDCLVEYTYVETVRGELWGGDTWVDSLSLAISFTL